jgi:hypothetical protein
LKIYYISSKKSLFLFFASFFAYLGSYFRVRIFALKAIVPLVVSCLFFISCSSEVLTPGNDFSETSLIHLYLASNKSDSINTRANGTLPVDNGGTAGTNEGYLNHICAALFNSSGNLVTLHEHDYASGSTETIATRKDATQMLVFANVPQGAFSGKYTLNDFYAVSQDLGYTTSVDGKSKTGVTTANSQSMKSLPMISAVKPLDWSSGSDLSLTVSLTRLVARVALTSLAQTFSDPYYFYVFPHGSTNPTKLVIKGTFTTKSGSTYTTYDPIAVNSSVSGNIISK